MVPPMGGERERGVSKRLFLERLENLGWRTATPDASPARKVWGLLDNNRDCDDEMRLWWTGGAGLGGTGVEVPFCGT